MVSDKLEWGGPWQTGKGRRAACESGVIDFNAEAVRLGDHIVRGTAADGQVRAFAVTARASVKGCERHQTSPVVSAALGRLLMAGADDGCHVQERRRAHHACGSRRSPRGQPHVTANNRTARQRASPTTRTCGCRLTVQAGKLSVGRSRGGRTTRGPYSVVHDLPDMEPLSVRFRLSPAR